ncbi:hypothetical protein [Streptomyces sp. B6B3]|uniref:hypothetical protein n=1 Tax=Streptomyces sp. B6B3 TaxID=3153570 RepID=UPI00325EFE85
MSEPEATSDAQAPRAEWLSDLVDIVVTPGMLHHLNRIEDGEERGRPLAFAHGYRTPPVHRDAVRQHLERLSAPPSDSLRYAAEAAAAGAHVLATTDPTNSPWRCTRGVWRVGCWMSVCCGRCRIGCSCQFYWDNFRPDYTNNTTLLTSAFFNEVNDDARVTLAFHYWSGATVTYHVTKSGTSVTAAA